MRRWIPMINHSLRPEGILPAYKCSAGRIRTLQWIAVDYDDDDYESAESVVISDDEVVGASGDAASSPVDALVQDKSEEQLNRTQRAAWYWVFA